MVRLIKVPNTIGGFTAPQLDIDLDDETQSGMADEFEPEDEGDDDLAEGNSDGDKEEERGKDQPAGTSKVSTTKRKAVPVEEKKLGVDGKKTAARNGKSAPATQLAAKKAKTGISKLEAVMMKEEETTQKVLDLKKTKKRERPRGNWRRFVRRHSNTS